MSIPHFTLSPLTKRVERENTQYGGAMIEYQTIRKLKINPVTGLPEEVLENQTKNSNVHKRTEHLADLAKKNYLGLRRPAEDYIMEATKQIVK